MRIIWYCNTCRTVGSVPRLPGELNPSQRLNDAHEAERPLCVERAVNLAPEWMVTGFSRERTEEIAEELELTR